MAHGTHHTILERNEEAEDEEEEEEEDEEQILEGGLPPEIWVMVFQYLTPKEEARWCVRIGWNWLHWTREWRHLLKNKRKYHD